ncbi:hypothetical protein H7347_07370 [Corynebacterium sp. zg-331]|uniref:hypothetical protein n=1 Tax=unclassified Corynebacterium TaxID=2624378 RepID=UPI00128BF845|nr:MULTISPECIES: hypothetical protein [unclassified Corynebacterium]MBC3186393.1 hypothetical protein [Corynebacterium sp. zg-331]MPV52879.1 hypothetical protein [Corynebacterium sp. zg331]
MSRCYSLQEVAEISGIAYSTLCEQSREGRLDPQLRGIRTGTKTVFPRAVIDRLFPPVQEVA